MLQRQILADLGVDHVSALGLGPLYQSLAARLARIGPVDRRRRPPLHVNAGNGFVFVSHVGTVHPSGFLPVPAGDVRERSLTEIYRESPLFLGLRDTTALGGRCGRCEFAAICGGSRSRAFAVTGDPFAEEPMCPYEPGSFGYAEELALVLPKRVPVA
jgi:radical SAM protein with 4Fe4S-binding SPASM domain